MQHKVCNTYMLHKISTHINWQQNIFYTQSSYFINQTQKNQYTVHCIHKHSIFTVTWRYFLIKRHSNWQSVWFLQSLPWYIWQQPDCKQSPVQSWRPCDEHVHEESPPQRCRLLPMCPRHHQVDWLPLSGLHHCTKLQHPLQPRGKPRCSCRCHLVSVILKVLQARHCVS